MNNQGMAYVQESDGNVVGMGGGIASEGGIPDSMVEKDSGVTGDAPRARDGAGPDGAGGSPFLDGGPRTDGVVATGGVVRTDGAVTKDTFARADARGALDSVLRTGGAKPDGAATPDALGPTADATSSGQADTRADLPVDHPPAAPPDSGVADTAVATPKDAALKLVWSDEFDEAADSRADSAKWTYVTWDPGTVNNELQRYTNRLENAFQDGDGHLVIRALRSGPGANGYTSGRLETSGKFSFRTGRIEVRAKLPAGTGSFPGIVLMGTSGSWPGCGELALVEQWGQDKAWFYSTAYAGSKSGATDNVKYTFPNATTASEDFHVYSLDWRSDSLLFQVDGDEILSTEYDSSSPFASIPEYIILDVAVGGDMGGDVDNDDFPMEMIVDYVRVYSY